MNENDKKELNTLIDERIKKYLNKQNKSSDKIDKVDDWDIFKLKAKAQADLNKANADKAIIIDTLEQIDNIMHKEDIKEVSEKEKRKNNILILFKLIKRMFDKYDIDIPSIDIMNNGTFMGACLHDKKSDKNYILHNLLEGEYIEYGMTREAFINSFEKEEEDE